MVDFDGFLSEKSVMTILMDFFSEKTVRAILVNLTNNLSKESLIDARFLQHETCLR